MTDNLLITTREATELIGVTKAWMSRWRKTGRGPDFETRLTRSETSKRVRYGYRLDAILAFLASRGATKAELEAARRKAMTTRKLELAREADKARNTAIGYIRRARAARAAAADAGHRPSAETLAAGEF